jgi:serpin B
MRKALRFDLPDDRIHTAFDYLDLALESRGKNAAGKDGKPFRLNVTNSIWGQKGSSFETPCLDTLAINYGAGLNVVDFIGATEMSRLTINRWVEDKTEKRIKHILPEGIVTTDTRMVLVNAVYFNAAWADQFQPASTQPGTFTKADGSTVQVSMMHGEAQRRYAKGDGYEAVEMTYDGNELSMLVIAPTKGTFATFESTLSGGKVLDILAGLESKPVNLSFPKLKLDGAFGLKESLKALGMEKAFTGAADFSGMSTTESLAIQDVVHKTFLEIDEKGTEAAAATAVIVVEESASPPPVEMNVDRPFITAIVDRQTKTLVFLGRILEPKL